MLNDLFIILHEFGAGKGGEPGNVVVRFLLPTFFWGILAWMALKEWHGRREKKDLCVLIAALTGVSRELLMFTAEFGGWRGYISFNFLYRFYPPLEHCATILSGILMGYAFLRYFLKRELFSFRFLVTSSTVTIFLFALTAFQWRAFLEQHQGTPFGSFWGDMLFRIVAASILGLVLVVFSAARTEGKRVPKALLCGFLFLFMDEFLMIFNLATHERHVSIYAPIRHNLHIWSIPLFLSVYWTELTRRTHEAEQAIRNLFDLSPSMLCIIDFSGVIMMASPASAQILGRPPEELHNMRLTEVGFGEEAGETLSFLAKNGNLKQVNIVKKLVLDDDTVRWLDWKIQPAKEEKLLYAVVSDITVHKQAKEEIWKLNNELEIRVIERTAQLENANRELEAFCYSVSHDLRAPLRHINGYCKALWEDFRHVLDVEGQKYLSRTCAACNRMDQLINGLLNLSRVSRRELWHEQVDLSQLARSIAMEFQEQEPDRNVEFVIDEEITAWGDSSLLHVVLQNLIGNAWKFTVHSDSTVIQFGITEIDGKQTYLVRDNGIGFDMTYADKMFGAFQRLHGADEFEGMGIGLATVQRVIHRHGGRVWGEGETGKGATIFFTLGNC